jgi:uncharacterized protein YdeI (YjbR/CyaY-like superfamily)
MEPVFFASPEEFGAWLERNHKTAVELWVGYHKTGTGVPSMTWPQSVDEALCYGWIDGVRRSVDADRYAIRFTPRTRRSTWSKVNLGRARELIRTGRMRPAGKKAYDSRVAEKSGVYSFEQADQPALTEAATARFRADESAWRFWESQPAGYRQTATWWVISAKQQSTRDRRLETLISDSAQGRRIGPLRRKGEADR